MKNAPPNHQRKTPLRVIVAAPYVLWRWHFGADLEMIENHLIAGDHVTVLACQGQFEACDMNADHKRSRCNRCRSGRIAGLELLSRPVNVESVDQLSKADLKQLDQIQTQFDSIEQLKTYKVDGFDLGMAALSSLVSLKRDPEVDLVEHRDLLARLLRTAWMSFRSFQNYLATHRVDRVYAFNGRYAPVRGILRACQQAGVECIMHERGHNAGHYSHFPNTLPHDQQLFQQRVRDAWQEAASDSERDTVAAHWFEHRAVGLTQGWISFVSEQLEGELPSDWNPNKRNLVFFSSSEDEFVAISDRWSSALYPNQLDAVRAVLASLEDDPQNVHVYLRMHPNLANVDNRQRREMESLRSPHLTVIKPLESTSTYALMKSADKVLTVGSTAGIETVFWGTPSILIGPSGYQDLDATYNATSHEELMQLIYADLEPKDKTPALMIGYYCATFGMPFEHFTAEDFLDGRFKGSLLSEARKGKLHVWLKDRPSSKRPKLSPLAPGMKLPAASRDSDSPESREEAA